MSIRKLLRASLPFANVIATGIATASITPGRTIERIVLALGGGAFTKAMITLVQLKANGKVFFEGSGTQIDKMNTFRGITASAAFLPLDFTEIKGRDKLDQMVGAFDTSKGIQNITIEVTIAGATAPTLAAYLVESGAQNEAYSELMTKSLRYPYNTSVGGALPIQLPFGPNGAVIKRIHVDCTTSSVSGLLIKQDGLTIHESVAALNTFLQLEHGRVAQASWYTADFIVDGNQANAWDTRDARSIEVTPTFAAASAGFILVEYYDKLGNL